MKRLALGCLLVLLSSEGQAQSIDVPPLFTWDLNLEGGYGRDFRAGGERDAWLARARVGALYINDRDHFMAGVTAEVHEPGSGAIGLQVEYLQLELGGWVQLGGHIDVDGHPAVVGALGWSLFGLELQHRFQRVEGSEDAGFWVGFLKLRVPVRHLLLAAFGI